MESDGFRASAVRSVATGLAILARQPFPHRVFPSITTASDWLGKELRAAGLKNEGGYQDKDPRRGSP